MQIGQKIIRLDTVDSTNNYIAILHEGTNLSHGTVILADEQTAGRGQRGAVWLAEPGANLLMSVFLKPDNLSAQAQSVLSFYTSICLVQLLRKFGISSQIKWPNDIYVGQKKIAGILIENSIMGSKIGHSIIGIGLNVNQMEFGSLNATSMLLETGIRIQLTDLLFSLLEVMNSQYQDIATMNVEKLQQSYESMLFRKGILMEYEDENGVFLGEIAGVTQEGLLRMKRDDKELLYNLKEISFVI